MTSGVNSNYFIYRNTAALLLRLAQHDQPIESEILAFGCFVTDGASLRRFLDSSLTEFKEGLLALS